MAIGSILGLFWGCLGNFSSMFVRGRRYWQDSGEGNLGLLEVSSRRLWPFAHPFGLADLRG